MIVAATIIDSKNPCIVLFAFQQSFINFILYAYTKFHIYIYAIWWRFLLSQKSRKTAFLQPNPVCDFDPWFYDFEETVMITGSGLKKIVYFSILRLFHAFLMQWFWCFLYGFCSIFSGYGVFRLFSGCNLLVLFAFTVNNFILYANSTEISGFSVLLCFWRPSILPCWYCRRFTWRKEALVVSSNCFRRLRKPHDMHLETASMVVFSMKNAIIIKVGTCAIETELVNTGGSDERTAWQIFTVVHQSTAAIIGRK